MSDDRDIIYAIIGFGFSIWAFFWGFCRLRRKRLIENIPTSTIRGLAMGLVELNGKAEMTKPLKSPLTQVNCVLYRYLIEEYRSSGKSGRWVKIASGNSFYCPFWLDDGTGKIMVFGQGAELILPVDYEYKTVMGVAIPANLIEFMEKNDISYKTWLGKRSLRFKEWFICPGENVYILGSAKKIDGSNVDYQNMLMLRIEELKNSPQKMKEVDFNKDGDITNEEWNKAITELERNLLEDTLKNSPTENPTDVIIGKGDAEEVFIISEYSEKELTETLSAQCLLGIYGGAILSVLLLDYLLIRLGIIRF